jgi:uncharacterized protein (DUF1015 family)
LIKIQEEIEITRSNKNNSKNPLDKCINIYIRGKKYLLSPRALKDKKKPSNTEVE